LIKVRKETKEEFGETTRGLIKEFRQVKQTIEKCESWQKEIAIGLEWGRQKEKALLYSSLLKVIMTATSTC